jgi:hypothetical protein
MNEGAVYPAPSDHTPRVGIQTTSLVTRNTNVDRLAAGCAAMFILVLAIAAYWDASIRILHAFEALPYALAAVLCLRHHKLGYLLGAASGAFWLWMAATLTSFVRNGFERLTMLVTTGHVDRWDQFIAVPAALSTGGLVVFSLWGYARVRSKAPADVAVFVVVLALVAAFFITIFWLFAPRFLELFNRFL